MISVEVRNLLFRVGAAVLGVAPGCASAAAAELTFWTDAEPFIATMQSRLGTQIERKQCDRFGSDPLQVCRFESAEQYRSSPRYTFDLGIRDDGRLNSVTTTYHGVVTTADVEPMRPFGALMGHVAEVVGMDELQAGEFGRYVGAGWTGDYLPPLPVGLSVRVWRTDSQISVSLRRRPL